MIAYDDGGGVLNVLIITGLSGAGKSHALRKMEDNGYFCVDNLPISLVDELVRRLQGVPGMENVALGIDSRNLSLANVKEMLKALREEGNKVEILFLDARDDVLMRRYSETRRNHPMARDGFVADGIQKERQALEQLREIATLYIDTSEKKPAELNVDIDEMMARSARSVALMIRSFGFKYGIPPDADVVMDMRFVPNPFWIPELKPLTGVDQPVIDYVMGFPQAQAFLDEFSQMLTKLVPCYLKEGKPRILIGIGCTGGQHRSVCMAEALGKRLTALGIGNIVSHRDLDKARIRVDEADVKSR